MTNIFTKDTLHTKRRDYRLKLEDIELAISEWGTESGTPIIALHGWLDNMASFIPMIQVSDWLEKNNIRLICVDWPGHGHSDHRPKGQNYTLLEYVQNLHDLIEMLNLSEVNILGHSLGGSIATLYSGAFPNKVKRLMLIEGLGPLTLAAKDAPKQLAKAIIERFQNKTKVREERNYPSIDPIVKARTYNTDLSRKNAQLLIERNLKQTEEGFQWRSDHRLKLSSHQLLSRQQVDAYINKLSMPVLLIYGEEGFVKRFPEITEMIEKYQHVMTVRAEGGHHLHMQHPQFVINIITEFMNTNK